MNNIIAISHASGVVAEAILERLAGSGLEAGSLRLLGDESVAGTRLPYRDGYLKLQDQQCFDFADCAMLLMPEADPELEATALSQGCLLVSHAIERDSRPLFLADSEAQMDISYSETSLRLGGPELCCLLPVLLELDRLQPILQLRATLLRSAEFRGKAGIDELATQTINLLNAREVRSSVFPQQIAFNILPEAADSRLVADLDRFLGNISCSSSLQTLNVPIFHGFAAAVQLVFAADVAVDQCASRIASLEMVSVKKDSAGPLSDCNQSFSCAISHVEQAPGRASSLQFWMITDPLRYGLANNYVNVAEFLLKSFL